tara:strand:- start:233 stop:1027 length:795 start_codon:yes stop_codon:yes gene_type:complete
MKTNKIYKMLSIAGSDNTCGAGIQADIKTCQALNAYCLTCVTTITSQNSKDVFKIFELPSIYIKSQMNSILQDYEIDCIKIGLISSVPQAKTICQILRKFNSHVPIVVDPIFKSSTDKKFNNLKNYASIYKTISKISPIFTPNLNEAKILLKIKYNTKISTEEITKKFMTKYKAKVVITDGGNRLNYCEDFLIDEGIVVKFISNKISSQNTHGSGCTFSSALAVNLAKGFNLKKSVKLSKDFTRKCILNAPKFNLKYGPVGHRL